MGIANLILILKRSTVIFLTTINYFKLTRALVAHGPLVLAAVEGLGGPPAIPDGTFYYEISYIMLRIP